MRKLLYYPDPLLLKPCDEVTQFDDKLISILMDMETILKDPDLNGLGISANQIGENIQVVLIKKENGFQEYVNPKIITSVFTAKANLPEGCLSAPGVSGIVNSRLAEVVVLAQDAKGKVFEELLQGYEAVCMQHEYDHLRGLFWFEGLNREDKRAAIKKWNKLKGAYK